MQDIMVGFHSHEGSNVRSKTTKKAEMLISKWLQYSSFLNMDDHRKVICIFIQLDNYLGLLLTTAIKQSVLIYSGY